MNIERLVSRAKTEANLECRPGMMLGSRAEHAYSKWTEFGGKGAERLGF